jgi:hypothetical protein
MVGRMQGAGYTVGGRILEAESSVQEGADC